MLGKGSRGRGLGDLVKRNKRMKKVIGLCAWLVLFAACHRQDGNRAAIEGEFSDCAGVKIILQEMDTRSIRTVDSIVPDNTGKISFSPVIRESGFWLLKAPSGKILVMLLNAGDQVALKGSLRDFPDNIMLKGPQDAMLLNGFFHATRQNERMVDSLEALLIDRQDSAGYFELTQKIDHSFRQIWERQRSLETDFLDKNPGSLGSLVVLNFAFGMSPVLSPERDLAYYRQLDSALSIKLPGNKHVMFHHKRVMEFERQMKLRK